MIRGVRPFVVVGALSGYTLYSTVEICLSLMPNDLSASITARCFCAFSALACAAVAAFVSTPIDSVARSGVIRASPCPLAVIVGAPAVVLSAPVSCARSGHAIAIASSTATTLIASSRDELGCQAERPLSSRKRIIGSVVGRGRRDVACFARRPPRDRTLRHFQHQVLEVARTDPRNPRGLRQRRRANHAQLLARLERQRPHYVVRDVGA